MRPALIDEAHLVGRERFPFLVRWQLVRHRRRYTWMDWRTDLRYLFKG